MNEIDRAMEARRSILNEAEHLVTGDRNAQYGPPDQDFRRTADMWTSLGFRFNGGPISAHNIAQAMIALKLSRTCFSPEKLDHWVDLAGYASCGGSLAIKTPYARITVDPEEERLIDG